MCAVHMAGEMEWKDSTAKSAANATRALGGTLKAAATAWWTTRLGYYEMITARGIICLLYTSDAADE